MQNMKILYSFPLRLGKPGIGMTAWHQVNGLIKQGVKVSLYCCSLEKALEGLSYVKETLKPFRFKLPVRVLGIDRTLCLHDKIVAESLKKQHNNIDILHCWPSGALATLATANGMGLKTVLERPSAHTRFVFEVTQKECRKLGMRLKKSHYAAYNLKRLVREEREFELADKLLCPSDFVIKTFQEQGFDLTKLVRHRYGYDPLAFSINQHHISESDYSQFKMLYVGECSPLKGLHYALQAWLESKASQNGKFLICGRMIPNYKKVIREYLKEPSIEYLGFRRNVQNFMHKSDVLVLPSLAEGSALVTYEARACGCVLLVSEAAGAICEHMRDGLVHTPGDIDTLREHIDLLASNRKLLARLRENSLSRMSNLTWEKAGQSLVASYRECLSNHRTSGG